jgi:methyl-accepting chemotaxis protein
MKWTIGRKLYGGFGVVVIATLIVGLTGILVFINSGNSFALFMKYRAVTEDIDASEKAQAQYQFGYTKYFYSANDDDLAHAQEWGKTFRENWQAGSEELRELVAANPGKYGDVTTEELLAALDTVDRAIPKYEAEIEAALEGYRTTPAPDNRDVGLSYLLEGQRTWERTVEPHLDRKIDPYVQGMMDEGYTELQGALRTGLILVIVVAALGLIAGVLLASIISRGLSRRAVSLRNAAEEMSLGRLDVAIVGGGSDEIAELAVAFERLRTSMRAAIDRIKKR